MPVKYTCSYSITPSAKKEPTDKTQRDKMLTKNTLSATIITVLGVYFIPILNGWSWASFISATFQVVLWVLFGILQLYTNYNFVVKEKVSILRKKKEMIAKFTKECEKGKYTKNIYDDKVVETQEIKLIENKVDKNDESVVS